MYTDQLVKAIVVLVIWEFSSAFSLPMEWRWGVRVGLGRLVVAFICWKILILIYSFRQRNASLEIFITFLDSVTSNTFILRIWFRLEEKLTWPVCLSKQLVWVSWFILSNNELDFELMELLVCKLFVIYFGRFQQNKFIKDLIYIVCDRIWFWR